MTESFWHANNDVISGLNTLKRTSIGVMDWRSQGQKLDVKSNVPFQDRLEELLVLELLKDGGRNYLSLSIRSLYKHVMEAITNIKNDRTLLVFPLAAVHEENQVTYRQRLGGYLHPRDMRKLVTPFSSSNLPEFIVRRHAILFNFDPLRCIILRDRLLVLVPDGADSVLVELERRLYLGNMGFERSFLANNDNPDSLMMTTDQIDQQQYRATEDQETTSSKTLWNRLSGFMDKNFFTKSLSLKNSAHSSRLEDNSRDTGERLSSETGPLLNLHAKSTAQQATMDETANFMDGNRVSENIEQTRVGLDQTSLEWADMSDQAWIELPFELQCTDAVLQMVLFMLSEDTYKLHEMTQQYVQEIIFGKRTNMSSFEDPLTLIRFVKDAVNQMMSRVKGFVQSLNTILDDYEDLSLMNLSRLITNPERFIQPVPIEVLEEESDEPELILESYLQQSLSLTNKLQLMQGQIDTTAKLVHQKLDANRNKILLANTILTAATLCATCANVVCGLLSVNLSFPMRQDDGAFTPVTCWIVASTIVVFVAIMYVMYRTGSIPSWNGI